MNISICLFFFFFFSCSLLAVSRYSLQHALRSGDREMKIGFFCQCRMEDEHRMFFIKCFISTFSAALGGLLGIEGRQKHRYSGTGVALAWSLDPCVKVTLWTMLAKPMGSNVATTYVEGSSKATCGWVYATSTSSNSKARSLTMP